MFFFVFFDTFQQLFANFFVFSQMLICFSSNFLLFSTIFSHFSQICNYFFSCTFSYFQQNSEIFLYFYSSLAYFCNFFDISALCNGLWVNFVNLFIIQIIHHFFRKICKDRRYVLCSWPIFWETRIDLTFLFSSFLVLISDSWIHVSDTTQF